MGKILWVERVSLKFHTQRFNHTLRDVIIRVARTGHRESKTGLQIILFVSESNYNLGAQDNV